LNYLRLEYRKNTETQNFYQNWKSFNDKTQEQYKTESYNRWNLESSLDDEHSQVEWISEVMHSKHRHLSTTF